MAYDLKNVFYLDTEATITKALKEKWKLIRSEEGTYFIEQI